MASPSRPWLESYPPDVPRSLEGLPEAPIWSLLARSAARHPDAEAVVFPVAPMARRLSYGELRDEAERLAGALASLGVRKGDRVGLLLPNCPQYVIAFYAVQRLGAVAVGCNPLYTQRELLHQLQDAGIEVLFALDLVFPLLGEVRHETSLREVIVTRIGDYLRFPVDRLAALKQRREARREGDPWPPVPRDARVRWWKDVMSAPHPLPPVVEIDVDEDPAVLVYTGGTTGVPKGAMLTHRNLVTNTMQSAAWFPDLRQAGEAVLCVLPFFHAYGLQVGMQIGIAKAAKLVLLPRFELDVVLRAIHRERATLFPGVPRIYVAINEAPETRRFDLRSVRACLSGAAPLPVVVAERFEEITGGRLVEGYGLSETSPVTHANPIFGRRKPGTIGLPLPDTDCMIVDLDDPSRELGLHEVGELCIAGPQVMKGYWNRPEETAQMIQVHDDGRAWLHTGDVARMDEDGYFAILDRKKDMIIVSGFNVYPTEVERVLYEHPAIEQVSVVGVPDERTGEAVKAFVVPKRGASISEEDVLAWCRDDRHGLTGYRVPSRVEIRDELPTTMIGKVLRRVLRDEEAAAAPAPVG